MGLARNELARGAVRRAPFVGLILALCLGVASPAVAGAADDPAPGDGETTNDPTKDAKLARRIEVLNARLRGAESWVASVETRLGAVEGELLRATETWERSKAELKLRRAELARAMWRLAAQRALLRKSSAQIYMQGGPWTQMNALLNARDLNAIRDVGTFSRVVLVNYIDVLRRIERQKQRIARLHAAIRTRTIERYAVVLEVRRRRDRIMAEWRRASAAREGVIRQLVALGEPILRLYRASGSQIKAIFREAHRGQQASKRRREMDWPIGGRISSRFGWRIHPIFRYRSFHTGVDIVGRSGRFVRASAPGRVLATRAIGAFGFTVVIDHGRALGTVYAHLSSFEVQPGEYVRTGEVIGRVGCTGWCTGPHVHYEIWRGVTPQNPVFWLS